MSVTFTELRTEGTLRIQGGGAVSATRRFLVPGATESVVRLNSDLLLAAAIGSVYPSEPVLKVSAHSVLDKVGGEDGYYVEAFYTVGGVTIFDFPPPDRQNLGFNTAGFQQHVAEIDMPIMLNKEVAVPVLVGPPTTVLEWFKSPKTVTLEVRGLRFQVEYNTDSFVQANLQAVNLQVNKIHRFWGADWLFRGGRQDKIFRDGVWNVVFQWETEEGHPQALLDAAGFGQSNPNIAPFPARPPHAFWDVHIGIQVPFAEPRPVITAKLLKTVIPTGHQTLPGYGTKWSL